MRCKIFSGKEIAEIEKEVNTFLQDHNKVLIDSIHQSADSELLYITIFYHSRTRAAKMKEAAIEEIKVPITVPLRDHGN